ncbi:MAG TPA: HD domain-containing protein [Burkholderiales bacterium]|nr:HD domain-containing protein [Burkholderiales bacterium]
MNQENNRVVCDKGSPQGEPEYFLTERFGRALAMACDVHRGHFRKGTAIPYVSHLLAVAGIVLEHGGSEDEAIAALLHDSVEDRGGEKLLSEIEARFGKPVADIVVGCSDTLDPKNKPEWRERKERYLAHLAKAPGSVRLVSAADKLHNARSIVADHRQIGDRLWTRFNAEKTLQRWYYRSLADVFRDTGTCPPLVEEVERAVNELSLCVG